MSMRNPLTYLISLLLLWINSSLANNLNEQPLYLNVLDIDNQFEERLCCAYYSMRKEENPVILKKLYNNDELFARVYRLTRKSTPADNNLSNDANIKEEYILRLFKSKFIKKEYMQVNIERNPIYNNFFYTYLYTTIQNKNNQTEIKEGMLPFLNKNNLKLFKKHNKTIDDTAHADGQIMDNKIPISNVEAMINLLDMAGCAARQLKLQQTVTHPGILSYFVEKNIALLNIPDNTLFNTMLNDKNNNINKILDYMYEITNIVEYLHQQNIAHGDISLANLFTLKDKVVLSGFNRSSFPDSKNTALGMKKFLFDYNYSHGDYYAPEIHRDSKENYYANATTASDIYSLGILFTELLYLFTSGKFNLNKLTRDYDPYECIEGYKQQLVFFNRYPYQLLEKIKYNLPLAGSMSSFIYSCQNFMGYYFKSQKENCYEIIDQLIKIINLCNQELPADRPTATNIKKMLLDIINKQSLNNS